MIILARDYQQINSSGRWSFEANDGDTSMKEASNKSDIRQRMNQARAAVSTEFRIPDFTVFALRRHGVPHRRLLCILEIKPQTDQPSAALPQYLPQIVTQAQFAFDAFPDLLRVFTIVAFGQSWIMYQFPRDELRKVYNEHLDGFKDKDTFNPARASKRPKTIDISQYRVIPFSRVLKADGSSYSSQFECAMHLITDALKARSLYCSSNRNTQHLLSDASMFRCRVCSRMAVPTCVILIWCPNSIIHPLS